MFPSSCSGSVYPTSYRCAVRAERAYHCGPGRLTTLIITLGRGKKRGDSRPSSPLCRSLARQEAARELLTLVVAAVEAAQASLLMDQGPGASRAPGSASHPVAVAISRRLLSGGE